MCFCVRLWGPEGLRHFGAFGAKAAKGSSGLGGSQGFGFGA